MCMWGTAAAVRANYLLPWFLLASHVFPVGVSLIGVVIPMDSVSRDRECSGTA
jgi:hypothetical protein